MYFLLMTSVAMEFVMLDKQILNSHQELLQLFESLVYTDVKNTFDFTAFTYIMVPG